MIYIDKRSGNLYHGNEIEAFEDHNTIEEDSIFDDGWQAASIGGNYVPEDNPWPEGSYAAYMWEDGWNKYDDWSD